MNNIVITRQNNRYLSVLFTEGRPSRMHCSPLLQEEGMLSQICLARVKDVIPAMKGAFLTVPEGRTVYLPLSESGDFLCANRSFSSLSELHQGDEIVVQITGEAVKTKPPLASAMPVLTGQYCVCSLFGHGIHVSRKLAPERQKELKTAIAEAGIEGRKNFQFTVRTNADTLKELTPLFQEMQEFICFFQELTEIYRHRSCPSCLYRPLPELIRQIQDIPLTAYEEIVTDEPEVWQLLKDTFPEKTVRLYQDPSLSLARLYRLDFFLQEALSRKVWLPCGGYLVIEPTEAMVVIDVNSGKAVHKGRSSQDYYRKVNREAAAEIARQLQLRNYSGMIMVDFINMESEKDQKELLFLLDQLLKKDQVRTSLVDMTALGIAEITRKKINRPLFEEMQKNS